MPQLRHGGDGWEMTALSSWPDAGRTGWAMGRSPWRRRSHQRSIPLCEGCPERSALSIPKPFVGPRQRVCQQEGEEPTFPGRRGVVLLLGGPGRFSEGGCHLLLLSRHCTTTDLRFPFPENTSGAEGGCVGWFEVPNPAEGSVGLLASACCRGERSPFLPLTRLLPSARTSSGGRKKSQKEEKNNCHRKINQDARRSKDCLQPELILCASQPQSSPGPVAPTADGCAATGALSQVGWGCAQSRWPHSHFPLMFLFPSLRPSTNGCSACHPGGRLSSAQEVPVTLTPRPTCRELHRRGSGTHHLKPCLSSDPKILLIL